MLQYDLTDIQELSYAGEKEGEPIYENPFTNDL
jgi:hypothetical protein